MALISGFFWNLELLLSSLAVIAVGLLDSYVAG